MMMNKTRFWVGGAAFAILIVLAGGWLFGITPQLAAASTANNDRATAIAANTRNQIQLARLKRDFENMDALKNQVVLLGQAVPSDTNASTFVTELNALSATNKVTITSISINDAKQYTPAVQAAGQTSAKATAGQVNSRITSNNFYVVPVTISVTGDYRHVLSFVNDVQMGPRLVLVSSLTTTGATSAKGVKGNPSTSSGSQKVDSTLGGYIYVLHDTK